MFEEIIMWSDGDPFFRCLELSFYMAISSVASGKRIMLRPSNSSSRVSRIPQALIGATHLIAARHVVLALKARCHAVEILLACSIPLFLIEFVTAWSWYGHFSKSLFSSNLWLVVYRLLVLHRHLSVNVSLQGNTTAFSSWVLHIRTGFLHALQ